MQMPDKSTNSHTRVHFIINDTKQNCPYLTKGRVSTVARECSWEKHFHNASFHPGV